MQKLIFTFLNIIASSMALELELTDETWDDGILINPTPVCDKLKTNVSISCNVKGTLSISIQPQLLHSSENLCAHLD